jgi:hypothetical protein
MRGGETSAGRRARGSAAAAIVALSSLGFPAPSVASPRPDPIRIEPIRIEVVSNRADLISGGDALVALALPASADPADVRLRLGPGMSPTTSRCGRTAGSPGSSRT